MAGNLVKWWKHKILGGYKQFSVQECTTDSEELMYHQVRAPSSCSAPPDLLLVSDRENNIPLKTPSPSPSPVVNIITTAAATACAAASGSGQKHHQHHQHHQQQQQMHPQSQQHGAKELFGKNAQNSKMNSSRNASKLINLQATTTTHHSQSHQANHNEAGQQQQQQQHQSRHHAKEERIHLEEFTCDVSVEGGKSSQPLQFSFTFYDLDGHHGKITKDDIVGIVYTIYESIGKSVVVPHCGSKTINVRLTVSPEGKSKAAGKLKKMQAASGGGMQLESSKTAGHASAGATTQGGHSRRQHRYRPRKLIKSDDEDDDSTSEKDLQLTAMAAAASASASASKSKSHAAKYNNRMKLEQQQQTPGGNCCQGAENNRNLENNMETSASASASAANCQADSNLYANVATNLKCCSAKRGDAGHADECRRCTTTTAAATTATATAAAGTSAQRTSDMYLKQASSRVKMLRKARKQKYQDHCLETRQRSLSVGSEACWKSRHAKNSPHHLLDPLSPTTTTTAMAATTTTTTTSQQHQGVAAVEDVVDGVQLRNGRRHVNATTTAAANRSSAECWNTALNRNDLISIIRESMEKNRLCFQLNGKPQASVSPIRQSQQRQRSNTVSKIPTLIANHSSSITNYSSNNINNISSNSNNNYNINSNNTTHCNNINNNSSSINFIPNDTGIHDISSTGYQQHQHQQQQQQQQLQQQQQQQQHHHHHSHHHLQPHIPIYHQQMAINPAVLAAQSGIGHAKLNLCGYDSFLHATICGGGTSHSPPPPAPPTVSGGVAATHTQQPIATVQPLVAASAGLHHHKVFANPTPTTNLIKTSKILRSGAFSQSQHGATSTPVAQQTSSPLYHGYQRLSSGPCATPTAATKHNLAALNSQNPSLEKAQVEHLEKWLHERAELKSQKSRKDAKNYDNLLFAKLTERLQDSSLEKQQLQSPQQQQSEAGQRRKQRTPHYSVPMKAQKRSAAKAKAKGESGQQQEQPQSPETSDNSNYATLIPINGDPIECETLLGSQTSDEETSAETPLPSSGAVDAAEAAKGGAETRHVQTGDLLHLNDDEDEGGDVEADPKAEATGRNSSQSNGSGAAVVASNGAHNSSSTSSLIHRYVHEHIHHHYHHFEDKDE